MSTSTTTMVSYWTSHQASLHLALPAGAPSSSPHAPPPLSSPSPSRLQVPPKKRKSPDPPLKNKSRKRACPPKTKKKRDDEYDTGSDLELDSLLEPIYRSGSGSIGSREASTSSSARNTRICITDRIFALETHHLPSYDAVLPLLRTYKTFFHNPDDPADYSWKPHPEAPPLAELEYPNSDCAEEFMLLEPKDKDHYNPIFDLETSVYTIIAHYMTPAQQKLFGTLPRTDFQFGDDDDNAVEDVPLTETPPPLSPLPGKPLHAFRTAISTRNGPLFMSSLGHINRLIRMLKYPPLPHDIFLPSKPNKLMQAVSKWKQIPKQVLLQVLEENYQRSVGPHVGSLKNYEAFSNEVYGELMPSLVYDIIENCNLDENSLFLDLGSGVGNLIVQASLQTGCRSYGIELQDSASRVAEKMVHQFRTRCTMWGLRCGDIEVQQGSMLESARVDELIKEADVVLVDNKMFSETLNESLKPKFLDLKDGAIVVSLKPFSTVNTRVTERNLDDMCGIFEVEERGYRSGDVSWGNNPGVYYVHRVNRDSYAHTRSRFEQSRSARRSRTCR